MALTSHVQGTSRSNGWSVPCTDGAAEPAKTSVPARRPLVVGIDGSVGGEQALEWALREAIVRVAPVRIVTVWTWDGVGLAHAAAAGSTVTGHGESHARQVQQVQVARVLARFGRPAPAVDTEVAQGDPASRLVESSCDADLLVLGSRGNGVVHDTLMGSVAEVCVRHAACPVVVVPGRPQVMLASRELVTGRPGRHS